MNQAARNGDYKSGHLLDICLELHGNITGSSDCSTKQELIKYRDAIQLAVNTWEDSAGFCKKFDDAVKSVCQAVLEEAYLPRNQWLFTIKDR